MNNKVILQYGLLAGVPYRYAESLRKLGENSISVIPTNKDFGTLKRQLPFDKAVYSMNDSPLLKLAKIFRFMVSMLRTASLIHYYTCSIFKGIDYRIFSIFKIPMVISFGGTDVRFENKARAKNPYFIQMPYSEGDCKIEKRLKAISKHIHYVITDYELGEYVKPYFKKVFFLPLAIDTNLYRYTPISKDNSNLVIIHVPTHKKFKATDSIIDAVEKLQKDGLKFDFRLLEPQFSQDQMREELSKADLVIDEIRCGAYGLTSIEAMALGKATVTYLREDLVEKYPPDLPIVSANPDTIYDKLKQLLSNPFLLGELGKKGRDYVMKYHSEEVIGPKLLNIYKEIGLKS